MLLWPLHILGQSGQGHRDWQMLHRDLTADTHSSSWITPNIHLQCDPEEDITELQNGLGRK